MLCWHVVKVYSQKNRFSIQFLLFDTLSTKMYRKNRKLNKKKSLQTQLLCYHQRQNCIVKTVDTNRHDSTVHRALNILMRVQLIPMWIRNCFSFRSTWVQPRFELVLVRFVVIMLSNYMFLRVWSHIVMSTTIYV
jgi:hypothetical protein